MSTVLQTHNCFLRVRGWEGAAIVGNKQEDVEEGREGYVSI